MLEQDFLDKLEKAKAAIVSMDEASLSKHRSLEDLLYCMRQAILSEDTSLLMECYAYLWDMVDRKDDGGVYRIPAVVGVSQ